MQYILEENVPRPPLLGYGQFNCEPGYESDALTTELLRTRQAVSHHHQISHWLKKKMDIFNLFYFLLAVKGGSGF